MIIPERVETRKAVQYCVAALAAAIWACGICNSLLLHIFIYRKQGDFFVPASGLKYRFCQIAIRLNDLMGRTATSDVGYGATVIGSVIVITIAFVVILLSSRYVMRIVWSSWGRVALLVAVPWLWLITLVASRSALIEWIISPGTQNEPLVLSRISMAGVALVDITAVVIYLAATWNRSRSMTRAPWLLAATRCILWTIPIWSVNAALKHKIPSFPALLDTIICTLSLFVGVWVARAQNDEQAGFISIAPSRAFCFIICIIAVISCLVLVPLDIHSPDIATPQDRASLSIKMTRTQCFGVCPAYTLVIDGAGNVAYDGQSGVKVHGYRTGVIESQRFALLLSRLDALRIFSLEDRAFEKCMDTPRVSLMISVAGKTKVVTSDTYCLGRELGPQAEFVQVAREIDDIANSRQWIK